MRLYATITSERATKGNGLGGNKYINIDLFLENAVPAGSISFRIDGDDYVVMYNDTEVHRQKAKRQKAEAECICIDGQLNRKCGAKIHNW